MYLVTSILYMPYSFDKLRAQTCINCKPYGSIISQITHLYSILIKFWSNNFI